MAFERENRSIGFERADELKKVQNGIKGLGILDGGELDKMRNSVEQCEKEKEKVDKEKEKVKAKIPNVSLMGLSMLGSESSFLSLLCLNSDLDQEIVQT